MNAKPTGKSYLKPILIGAAIFTVLIAHFAVSQFIALRSEADSTVAELTEKQASAIEPKIENKAAETIVAVPPITTSASAKTSAKANAVSTVVRIEQKSEPKRAVEKESVNRKPAARETKTERLRRAERILTGI